MSWLSPLSWGSKLVGVVAEGTKKARDIFTGGADVGKGAAQAITPEKKSGGGLLNLLFDPDPFGLAPGGFADYTGTKHSTTLKKVAANAAITGTAVSGVVAGFTGELGAQVASGVGSVFDRPAPIGNPEIYSPKARAPVVAAVPQMGSEWAAPKDSNTRVWDALKGEYFSPTVPKPTPPAITVRPPSVPPITAPVVRVPSAPSLGAPSVPKVSTMLPNFQPLTFSTSQAVEAAKVAASKVDAGILAAAGLGVGATVAGAAALASAAKKKATTKKKTTKKKSSKKASTAKKGAAARDRAGTYKPPGRSTRRNGRGGAVKDTYRGSKVYIAKNGSPYIILKSGPRKGRAMFIKK